MPGIADRGDEQESAGQHTDGGAGAVAEVERGDDATRRAREQPDDAVAHEREGRAQQHRLWQHQQAGDQPLERAREQRLLERRQHVDEGPLDDLREDGVESRCRARR